MSGKDLKFDQTQRLDSADQGSVTVMPMFAQDQMRRSWSLTGVGVASQGGFRVAN